MDRKNTEQRAMLVEAARSDRLVAEEKLHAGREREAFAHLARAVEYDRTSTLAAEKAAAALNTWQHPLPSTILAGHERWVLSAQFSPDGTRIVTASEDKTARVWDAATGKPLATLAGHEMEVWGAQFSPDGSRIVTASFDKTARMWDAAFGKPLATLAGHGSAQFSPDGTRIFTVSRDKTARVWTLLPSTAGPPPEWFPDFLRYLAQMRLNSDGELETLKPDDWLALREQMRAVRRGASGQDTPYLRILRRYVPE